MRRVELKVIARAKKECVEKISANSYRIKVQAPPEKGKANKKVLELIAKELGVKKGAVRITSGAANNRKIVEID
ncbi:MAG: DUF167 domain-containing protein [Candidatus Omnitrophica bacterium]|nr:DUF167 domain-containing protein [Candidatus Omnitrophota bacterium]